MHSEKKLTKEDTWRPAELRKHIRDKDNRDGHSRRREDEERKHRGGQSVERRHRDPVESRPERDKERDRRHGDSRDRQRRDGSHDRRGDKDRGRRDDEDRRKRADDGRDRRETAPGKEDLRERERHRERHKDKEKERAKVKEKHPEEDRDKRREDREKERRREEPEREQKRERRRHDESDEVRRDPTEKLQREPRDRKHRGEHEEKRRDRDVQEDRRRTEDREYKEEARRHKEERERRHKERRRHDETHKHDSASRERQDSKQSADDARNSRGDRERTERDRHKERRKKEEETDIERRHKERGHREAEDVERNHRERRGSKKSSSGKSPTYEKREEDSNDEEVVSKQQTAGGKNGEKKAEKADLAEQEYEEDFEEYEEDFEDMEESADEGEDGPDVDDGKEGPTAQASKEIEAIRRAMAEENERAGTAQSRRSAVREEREDRPSGSEGSERNQVETSRRGKFIDFVAAKQREVSQKVATKQKKRSTELLRLIDLDVTATFSLLDLPPVSEYEMYIKSFGNANAKQAYVQCNEDDTDRDVQTEEIEMCEKWTQHPPEYRGACGDPNPSQEARDKTRGELILDSQRLMSFLRSASQVMVVLLEEDQAERKSLRKLKTQKDSLSFSDGSLQLNAKLPFLLGRQISLVHFSQAQKHTMLSVHTPTATASAVRLDSCAVVCVWNIWEPSRPQQILIYGSEVQCCCFSPGKSSLVFAGTPVGSVVLWDLREHSSTHYRLKIGEDEWTFRHPTFSTDAVMCGSGHVSPVTCVEVVPSFAAGRLRPELPPLASEEESSGLSFQLASLDESGLLNFWVVVELPRGNEAGSPTDLGLRPGGKVKLLHSSSLLTVQRPSLREAAKTRPFQTLLLKYHPTDSNQFFIGTNLGLVSHGTSHGLKAPPQFYRFQEVDERTVDVSAIHFSPFRPNLFLVGCADGSIRLHAVSHDRPLAEWMNSTAGEAVVSLQWAQTRPAVFCVFDAASNLHVWDMLKDDAQPVMTEKMTADRVTAMAVFGDSRQQNTYSGIALAHESGNIELRYFTQTLTVPSPAEEGKLESLLTEAF